MKGIATLQRWRELKKISNKGPGPLQRGDNHKNVKMVWCHLKIFFSRPILIRLGTNHSWRERIQICLNEGNCHPPGGDNSKRVKLLKIFLSRTSRSNSIKLGTNYPWVKGIPVCSNKGPGPLQRGDNRKNVKMMWCLLKMSFSRTTGPILTRLCANHP
jgi:hypothetical protein